MSGNVISWLASRTPAPPTALAEKMAEALGAREGEIPDALAAAAIDELRRVLASDGGRDVAIDLLAADALLTHACEAAAEAGPEALERLLDAVSPASLAQDLLEDQP